MQPLHEELAQLLADHPDIAALRSGAPDPAQARDQHVARLRQILRENSSYAEDEIFVHLQQLTHMPREVHEGGDTLSGSD